MKTIAKYALGALMTGAAAFGVTAPAQAGVGISIGIGGPAYYGYNYYQPCRFYFNHDLPAPNRCYADYRRFYGSGIYLSNGFVFRDRATWGRWRNRDDFRHWRTHNWRGHEHAWHAREHAAHAWHNREQAFHAHEHALHAHEHAVHARAVHEHNAHDGHYHH